MLDIGWQELFIVAVLVIIVIGPKDLPRAMRTVAAWVRKARSLAREFQGGLDNMMNEADLDDVKKQIESTKNFDFGEDIESGLDPDGDFADDLDMTEIEADLDAAARTEAPKSKPTESKPTESKPTESKPTESKPTESKPTESKPTESKPTESNSTESKPTESNSTKSTPAEGDAATTDNEEGTTTASKAGG
jgi:sec-independent protein translocase protein TatB